MLKREIENKISHVHSDMIVCPDCGNTKFTAELLPQEKLSAVPNCVRLKCDCGYAVTLNYGIGPAGLEFLSAETLPSEKRVAEEIINDIQKK
jgi:hypothetical protein